jgi:stage II sporulation protein P
MKNAVHVQGKRGRFGKVLAGAALLFLFWMAAGRELEREKLPVADAFRQDIAVWFAENIYDLFLPGACATVGESCTEWVVNTQVENFLPLYGVARRELWSEQRQRQYREEQLGIITYENELSEEGLSNAADGTNKIEESNAETDMQTLLQAENNAAREVAEFVPHEQQSQVNLEELQNYETLVKNFYTIDSNTMAGSDQLQVDSLLKLDMSIKKEGEGPQILIYHTHSQETFADSVEGDAATTIEGVGEHLSQILQEKYGYRVLHHTGRYDVETRNNAYGNALPELEKLLEENPSIQVVIDLHRDEVASDTKLVIDLDGRPTARFMFFNGLSRTKQSGDITYLQNDNIAGNLAFSFQMQLKCEEYYPGLTRKIYLKGYRYNMHLKPRSLLVELGAQNNTVEEAMNACEPLAHVLDMVLSGE